MAEEMAEEKEKGSEMEPGGSGVSRRSFIKGAVAGAAVAAVATTVPYVLTRTEVPPPVGGEGTIADTTGPVVVYVPDPSKSDVVIMRGEKEAVRKDATLVSRVIADGLR